MTIFGTSAIDSGKVAIYVRWSTDEQESGTTLEVQTESCQYFILSQHWTFNPDLVFVDDGYSGGNVERPALARLRKAVDDGEVQAVVVYKLDRLSRRVVDCVKLVREEWYGRCSLFSTAERFDTESPVGKMIFNILISFAEFERDVIRDRTQSGKKKRASQGRNAGHRYIYGYRRSPEGGYEFDGVDPATQAFTGPAAIARRIFLDYLNGASTALLAERLSMEGIPSPQGADRWRTSTISRILDNPTYAGTYRYGMSSLKLGEKRKLHDEPTYVVAGVVPPLIAPAEWERVRRLRAERRGMHPRAIASLYLLSGIARCGKCGQPINGKQGSDKRYYSCLGRISLRTCDCALMGAPMLEEIVLNEVKQRLSGESVRQHVQMVAETIAADVAEKAHVVATREAELAELEKRMAKLEDDYFKGDLDGKTYGRLTERVEGEKARVASLLEAARRALTGAKTATVDVGHLEAIAARIDVWESLSPENLKQVLHDVIDTVLIYQEKSSAPKGVKNPNEIDIKISFRTDVLVSTVAGAAS